MDQRKMNRNKKSNSNNEQTKQRIRDDNKKIQCIKNDTKKTIDKFIQYYELNEWIKNNPDQQSLRNRLAKIEEALLTISSRLDDEFNANVFGGHSIQNIRDALNEPRDHLDRKIEWMRSKMDIINDVNIKGEEERMRMIYEDNPKKALNHYVWTKDTPSSKITASDIASHYGSTWSAVADGYFQQDLNNTAWKIPKVLDENDNTQLFNSILKKSNVKKAIMSRNNLSAHGRDAVSNAILRLCPDESTTLLRMIFKAILTSKYVPKAWKTSRTVMLYKKSDPNNPANWRPIGITSVMYRIFTCTISKAIMGINMKKRIFHHSQKGFTTDPGCSEHISVLNEIIHSSKRIESSLHMLTIDFTNAFGSVPHDLIFDTLSAKGFNNDFIQIIRSIYSDNQSIIEVNGTKSDKIPWRRGVIQGCPLSPILFNCCLDPLLWGLETQNHHDGVTIKNPHSKVSFRALAYADDVILVSYKLDSLNNMIRTLQDYQVFSKLSVAPKKCTLMSRSYDGLNSVYINDIEIQAIDISQSMSYLGVPISGA